MLIPLSLLLLSCRDSLVDSQWLQGEQRYANLLVDTTSYMGFELYRSKVTTSDGTTYSDHGRALFGMPDSTHGVWVGTVAINGVDLYTQYYPTNSHTQYSTETATGSAAVSIPYSFNGDYVVFNSTGNAYFPALRDSVKSPMADLTISYPTPNDTVSKSTGFSLTWNGVGADAAYVVISDSSQHGFSKHISDNGSCSITTGDLSSFSPGPILIILVRGNYNYVGSPVTLERLFLVYTLHQMSTNIKS
jgi:hypothetical protein